MKARFCGRERELRLLNANLEEAGGGRGVVTALVGEPGVGKSRLASEHAEHAREQGFRVAWGRAWEAGGAPAYWPLRLLFEELCAKPSSTQAHALSTIRGLGNEEHQQRSDPSQARFEVFDEAASLVLEEAEKSPLLCILDDVHAADLASIELLTFLITRCQHHPIAWVLSWRHVEAHAVRVATAMSHLSRHSTVVPLERLTENETLRLLDNASTPLSQAARESVYRSSAGNPLFALEMASSLALQGDDHVGSALPVAAGISALVDDRLRSHTAQTQDALICAAVIGREASEELWSAALGISVADLPPIKSQCLATGLLEVGNGPPSWSVRFHHDLVREALVGSAHTDTVRRAHERLVARLSSLVDEGNYSALEPLAHHALLAPQCFEIDTVLGWVLAASRRAQSTCAYEKSLALLERARETLGAGLDNHGAFTLALAQAHQLLGKPEKAMQLLHSALEASRDEPGAYAEAVLVSGARYALGDLHLGLVERIDEALARLKPDDIPLRARLLSRKAAALTPAQHPEETLQLARQAWKLSEQISDPANQLEVLVGVGSAMADFAHPDERIPVNQRLVQLASASGDRALALRGLSRLVTDYVEGGQVARAEQLLAERNELANDLKLPRFGWMETLFDSMRAMMDGRIDESKNAIDRAEVACSGLADAERCLAIHKTWHRLLLDDQDALREYEPTALATLRTMPPALSLAVRVAVAHRRGDLARCKDELAGLSVDLPHCATNTLATLTEAVTAVGRDELVEAFIEHLKPHSGTLAVWGLFGLTCGPPIDASLGLLYGRRGDTEKAAEHFSRALALASQLGARAHRPWIRYWQAQALGANGPTPSEVAAAADEARDLGMDHLARRLSEDRATPPDEAAPLQPQLAITEVGEGWRIDHSDQERFVLKDLKGLRMLARLVNEPNREIHALELAGDGQAGSPDVGDSGEHLDDQAIEAYRARLEELAEMTSRAEAVGHTEAAERARSEDAALRSELARALGLGGRKRRAGAASERARTSAQRRIRAAIARIAAQSPILGEHLRATIRTGTYCCYRLRPR